MKTQTGKLTNTGFRQTSGSVRKLTAKERQKQQDFINANWGIKKSPVKTVKIFPNTNLIAA